MKKVLLVGNFGARNVGDEIILWTALQKYPEAVVMTADETFSQRFLNNESAETTFIPPFPTGIRSLIKFIINHKYREIYRKIDIDTIIFPGGGLLAIKLKAYFVWGITMWWLRKYFPKAEIIFEHQGVDATIFGLKRAIIKYFFRKSNKISVRDKDSQEFLRELNINAEENSDCVEIWLKNNTKKELFSKNIVLINACREIPTTFYNRLCTEVLGKHEQLIFLCFEPKDARYVPREFRGKVVYPESIKETFEFFKKAKIAIGQRLHFLILANHLCGSEKTLTLGKPYAQKVDNFTKKYIIKSF